MDERNLPRPAGDVVDDGVPATEEVRDEVLRTGDTGVADMPMPDRPWAARDWGTTEFEERSGEPLGVRLAREIPEGADPGDPGSNRVWEAGAGDDLVDFEDESVGDLEGARYDSLSAEEAAMHVRGDDEGLGLNRDPDPGYLDERP
jgi:hypothetical protein